MTRKYLQELIKNLQEFYKCPSCDTNYHFDDIKFLGQIDSLCFMQLTCHSCSMPVLYTVSVSKEPRSRAKSDVTVREEAKFTARGAITSTEIAEFHRFITSQKSLGKLTK